jgi:hypothetical protein
MSGPGFDAERGEIVLGGARLVFHCHHYNVILQRSLEDALGPRAVEIQRQAAAEVARLALRKLFSDEGLTAFDARMARAAAVFSDAGFGRAALQDVTPLGGRVELRPSHYAVGWIAKWGPTDRPVDHFAAGFFKGALAAAADLAPERVAVEALSEAASREGATTVLSLEVR